MIEWIVQNYLPLILTMLVFGTMVFIHELGHFLVAKKVGVTVHEFAVGFGPRLIRYKKDGTEYCLRLIPLGGFVQMEGEDKPSENPNDQGSLQNKSVKQKIAVVAAGCIMNYAAAILLFWLVGTVWGVANFEVFPSNRISKTLSGSPAEKVGLQGGDVILSVNSTKITSGEQLIELIHSNPDKELNLKIKRKLNEFTIKVTPYLDKETNFGMIGFTPEPIMDISFKKVSFIEGIYDGCEKVFWFSVAPVVVVYKMFTHEIPAKMVTEGTSGPVGIFQMTFTFAKKGIPSLLYLAALLNVCIGWFNLVPFPALDGSRIAFLIIEGIRKKPILNSEKEGMVHWVGLMLLMALVLIITYNDIIRIMHGKNFFR